MNTFYIVRHGETVNNIEGRLSGWGKAPLTERGLVPTKRVVEKLRPLSFEAVYASDLVRTRATAEFIVSALGISTKVTYLPGLREVGYGEATDMLKTIAYEKYPGIDSNTNFAPPGGESLAQMQARVLETMRGIDQQHTDANILIVAHEGVMSALEASFLGEDFGHHNITVPYPHDRVSVCTIESGQILSFEQFAAS